MTTFCDERDFTNTVVELALRCRWAVTHFRAAKTRKGYRTAIQGQPGFPDLVLARAGVVLIRELKTERGKLSSEQHDWAEQIQPGWRRMRNQWALGEDDPDWRRDLLFDVWRPVDWEPLIIPTLTAPRDGPPRKVTRVMVEINLPPRSQTVNPVNTWPGVVEQIAKAGPSWATS